MPRMKAQMLTLVLAAYFCLISTNAKPTRSGSDVTLLSSSEEKFQQQQAKLMEKMKQHQDKMKEIETKLKEKQDKRRQLLIKKGKIQTPYGLHAVNDPDYFIRTQPPNSAEKRAYSVAQAEVRKHRDYAYDNWEQMEDPNANGTMATEHFDWPDESKDIDFFEKVYKQKPTKHTTPPDPTLDGLIHPFDNPEHPHYQDMLITKKQYYRYNSAEIDHYNHKYNLTLSKDMFTPHPPFVTGCNLSDWYNWKNIGDRVKIFNYPLDLSTMKALYMKYVFTPISNTTLSPGHDPYVDRIIQNLNRPKLKDHLKNSTWCFICGDTFSHPRDRMTHVTEKHYQYGDYGQDRLSDPNWTWKEDIQIYRKPTLLPEYYEQYVDPDHLTMDISFDHYAHWDAKRKAGEINFPNRPDCQTTTPRYPIDRKRYQEIRQELRHFIWNPPKSQENREKK
uniref:C2H2-type domain-containing protein n=1 Tax=Cacopsylla melanoneura TaxID=428564 RepID=A0A8D8Q939_9HEMI